MSRNRLLINVMVVTAVCFLISYWSSKRIPHKDKTSFPLSIVSGYSETFGKKFTVAEFEKFNMDEVAEFDIQTMNTDVELRQTETRELKISLEGNYFNIKPPLNVVSTEKRGNQFKLRINEASTKQHVLFEGKLILEVPKTIKKVNLMSVGGDVRVEDAKFNEVNINTVSGDIYLSFLNDSPIINANTNSGDVYLQFGTSPNVAIKYITVDGSLDVADQLKARNEGEGKIILGDGKGQAFVKTISGDLRIK